MKRKSERGVTQDELAALGSLAESLQTSRVRLHRGEPTGGASRVLRALVLAMSQGRAVALGNHVFLPDHCAHSLPVVAHELVHCAQYQAWGPLSYFARGAAARVRELGARFGLARSPYAYEIEPGKPLSAYGMEQQAQIVEDCVRLAGTTRPPGPARGRL